ncbi:MAG TPA: tRNA (N6-threonylcarbamoyladenosine(37)-N6)-methyltransferase TrmO [Candidatus Bathyarchaeia archaeon]|nr:tRNA (N6-threonylcarbamoyladenosine(37)-N6)-methyltransferase TrmO [Candidatus Bathyarchaeia archaeon]
MLSDEKIALTPIGYVKTDAVGNEVKDKKRTSKIVLKSELVEALDGVEGFSHVFILFWLNEVVSQTRALKFHPRGRKEMPLLGIFALRTNQRPNPIGLTLVELLNIGGNTLTVRGLDAYDGTPVLDIKPFDAWDCAKNMRVPEWWTKLNQ